MPVYETTIAGVDKPRLIRADTPAAARNHVVTCRGVSAERMADLMAEGVKLEKATPAEESGEAEAEAAKS
jgi:hypothetical protein